MAEETCTIESTTSNRWTVWLRGALEDVVVERMSTELLPRLREVGGNGELIIDMSGLESCTTEARMALTSLQQEIAKVGARTAFVAERPRFRGIGLFVAHSSGDPNARSFHVLAQAQSWLVSNMGRIESLTDYLDRAKRGQRPGRPSSKELRQRLKKLRDSSDEVQRR